VRSTLSQKDWRAELRVDKHLVNNKKLLSDLLEKEKEFQHAEGSKNNE